MKLIIYKSLLFVSLIYVTESCCMRNKPNSNSLENYLLSILHNKLIQINDTVYTFNFINPPVDTFQETFDTKRIHEFLNFCESMNALSEDTLLSQNISESKILKAVGKPSLISDIIDPQNQESIGKSFTYTFDLGIQCNPDDSFKNRIESCDWFNFKFNNAKTLTSIKFQCSGWGVEYILEKIHEDLRKEYNRKNN